MKDGRRMASSALFHPSFIFFFHMFASISASSSSYTFPNQVTVSSDSECFFRVSLRTLILPFTFGQFSVHPGALGPVLIDSNMSTNDSWQPSRELNLTALQPEDNDHPQSWRNQNIQAVGSRKDNDHPRPEIAYVNCVFIHEIEPLTKFSHGELVLATTNFSDDKKLGEGEFGSVFKGYLSDSDLMVAVKKIPRVSKECKRVYVQMNSIGTFPHKNLVELIGWSYNPDELLLVFKFMANGSLDTHLFGKRSTLTWPIRYKTALGVASALLYLQEEWELPVAHRAIKSSNIMLDSDFNAKLGEFGLNWLIEQDRGTTILPANLGYLAPEYLCSRRASKESNVYSFGVVALEIASGSKSAKPSEDPTMGLVERIWHLYENGRLLEAVDVRLGMDFDEKEMECLLIVGLWCAHPDYNLRPSIRKVISVLRFEAEMPCLPNRMPVVAYMGSSASAHSSLHSMTTSSITLAG